MYAKLFSKSGVFSGKSFVLDGESRIGRKADNEVRLSAGTISAYHARIFPDESGTAFLIEDLGSLNGTSVDGVPVRGIEKLGPLHVITFAENANFVFCTVEGSAPEGGRKAAVSPERSKHETAIEGEAQALVEPPVFQDSSHRGKHETNVEVDLAPVPEFDTAPDPAPEAPATAEEAPVPSELVVRYAGRADRLPIGESLVGRVSEAAIRIDDPSVSRRHALLLWDGSRLRVRDLDSSNGTFVGDREVSGEQALELPADVRFGTCELRIEVSCDD